jgi:lipopolysaccharide/colanic/teichoic acid biosynthesis glycosyltransferase
MKTQTITIDQTGAPHSVTKEIFDRTAAAIGLLVLLPLFGIIAVLIKLDSRGPVFFKHRRVGRFGRLFKMYKFRTMVQNADKIGPGLTAPGDTRITKLGKFLRRTSLDELPQLINVLKGEMSIVGPRPEIPEIVQMYSEQQLRALLVKPGITGLSQINGRDDLPLDIKLAFEVTYVDQFSLKQDLIILLKTFPALISGKGNRY